MEASQTWSSEKLQEPRKTIATYIAGYIITQPKFITNLTISVCDCILAIVVTLMRSSKNYLCNCANFHSIIKDCQTMKLWTSENRLTQGKYLATFLIHSKKRDILRARFLHLASFLKGSCYLLRIVQETWSFLHNSCKSCKSLARKGNFQCTFSAQNVQELARYFSQGNLYATGWRIFAKLPVVTYS